jgi:hypothetical protein
MAETLLMASTAVASIVNFGETLYETIVGFAGAELSENTEKQLFHTAGRISNFIFKVDNNSLNGSTTVSLRLNAVTTDPSISVPAGTTGDFQDDTSITQITAGDIINYIIVAGGTSGSLTFRITRSIFTPDQDTITHNATYTAAGGDTFSTASTTWYNVLNGSGDSIVTTEADVECRQRKPGTYRNLVMNINSNARTTATTVRLRVNNANSALSVSIGAGLSGFFSDTSNQEAIVVGDDVNFSLTTGTGVGDLVTNIFQVEFVSAGTDNIGIYIAGNAVPPTTAQGVTRYWPIMGLVAAVSTETDITIPSGLKRADWLEFTCNVTQNNVDNASTFTLRNNRVDTSVSISIPANTTGIFTDATANHTASYPMDEINIKVVTGAGVGGDTISVSNTLIWAFITPFGGTPSLAMRTLIEDYNLNQQSHFFGAESPMFGD